MTEPAPVSVLSAREHDFLNYIEEHYLTHGGVPSGAKVLEERPSFNAAFYKSCFAKKEFREALAIRGVVVRGTEEGSGSLTEEQLVVANTLLDRMGDTRSNKKKLAELGISSAKYEGWLRDPAYQAYLRNRAEAMLGDNLHESHLALIDRVRSGDINAIKYYNEITGRYNPNASKDQAVDVASVIGMIVEVIQRHVQDPQILQALAEDISLIAGGIDASTNHSLTKPTQVDNTGRVTKYTPTALPQRGGPISL